MISINAPVATTALILLMPLLLKVLKRTQERRHVKPGHFIHPKQGVRVGYGLR